MICIHHNKDLDGFTSGAIVKLANPDCTLIGWDYKDPIPWTQFPYNEEVIMVDISFPVEDMLMLLGRSGNKLTVIDHHISFNKMFHEHPDDAKYNINYIYDVSKAACEITWKHFFPKKKLPIAVEWLGMYDTWRNSNKKLWEDSILPFQYYMRTLCASAEEFPIEFFYITKESGNKFIETNSKSDLTPVMEECINYGTFVLDYQSVQDELACISSAFDRKFMTYNAVCLNIRAFSTDTVKSVYDPSKHDLAVGIHYTGKLWTVSLRSDKIDVSVLARIRGGGGHKAAAGFEAKSLDDIFSTEYDKEYKKYVEEEARKKLHVTSSSPESDSPFDDIDMTGLSTSAEADKIKKMWKAAGIAADVKSGKRPIISGTSSSSTGSSAGSVHFEMKDIHPAALSELKSLLPEIAAIRKSLDPDGTGDYLEKEKLEKMLFDEILSKVNDDEFTPRKSMASRYAKLEKKIEDLEKDITDKSIHDKKEYDDDLPF